MEYEVKQIGSQFMYVIDGDESELYRYKQWCIDDMEDKVNEIKADENDYYCAFCQEHFVKKNVNERVSDRSFTAPYGELYDLIKDVALVAVCPICGDDLEECK